MVDSKGRCEYNTATEPRPKLRCGSGGTGRRVSLRSLWPKRPWGFDSPLPHQLNTPFPVGDSLNFVVGLGRVIMMLPDSRRSVPDEALSPTREKESRSAFQGMRFIIRDWDVPAAVPCAGPRRSSAA